MSSKPSDNAIRAVVSKTSSTLPLPVVFSEVSRVAHQTVVRPQSAQSTEGRLQKLRYPPAIAVLVVPFCRDTPYIFSVESHFSSSPVELALVIEQEP